MSTLIGSRPTPPATAGTAAPATGQKTDIGTADFETEVILGSARQPIVVDFWATWCGPCRQLTPTLEKVIAATKGRVRLVKVDIDKSPELAQALRIQSVPTVYAFYQGRPVDAFQGALPESQVKQFVDQLANLAGAPEGDPIEAALAEAAQFVAEGDTETAAQIYDAVLAEEPAQLTARVERAKLHLGDGDLIAARALLDAAPKEIAQHKEFAGLRAAIELAEQSAAAGPVRELEAKVAADPADHQARLDLALAYMAENRRQEAVDALLESVRRDRAWNEEAARKQLVKFFEAFGVMDPLTVATRKRLSAILFA